jgi:septal ring factor EnvC (AmiA/AmiB activator)
MVAFTPTSAQTTSRQLEQLQRDLKAAQDARDAQAARANTLQGEIANLSAQERTLNNRVTELNARLTKLENERAQTQVQLDNTQRKSDALALQIKTLNAKIDYGKVQVSRLIVSLDREKSNRYVRLLSRADNAFDLAVKTRDLDTIQDVNLNVINELRTDVAQRNAKNNEYIAVIAKLNGYQRTLESKKVSITQNRTALNSSIASLRRTQLGRKALLLQAVRAQQAASVQAGNIFSRLSAERARLAELRRRAAEEARRRRIEEARRRAAEAARIAAIRDAEARQRQQQLEAQRQTQANADIASVAPVALPASIGRLLFPIQGGRITADFGAEGDWMVITAPQAGAPVYAAAAGQVIESRLLAANYGWTVIIGHTESLDVVTTYANLQAPGLAFGQAIRAGQIIGYTGGGTLLPANEMHFQVVRNNTPVNPRGYF